MFEKLMKPRYYHIKTKTINIFPFERDLKFKSNHTAIKILDAFIFDERIYFLHNT